MVPYETISCCIFQIFLEIELEQLEPYSYAPRFTFCYVQTSDRVTFLKVHILLRKKKMDLKKIINGLWIKNRDFGSEKSTL